MILSCCLKWVEWAVIQLNAVFMVGMLIDIFYNSNQKIALSDAFLCFSMKGNKKAPIAKQ
ncbi:hypothetical protein H744_1c0847 [Photobacterium gaetbulicola Gung47]|uniref:Uncharacterized protein n=1 Tax=Photobacterium gaetbulicola Gung47 TaxID=658445 RepID=A0A0C5WI85_9GAMM|nr:hypothetical protein H744_1c0847 [Photobacterium gaetbulicola Gung47]